MLEEAILRTTCDDGGSPGEDGEIGGGVEGEGEQVKGDQHAGEGFLTMSEIVFEVVSVGLEHVESLVLDLPACATAGGQLGDGVGRDREIRDEAVVIGAFTLAIEDLTENQFTWMASSVARSGTASSQR